MTDIETLRALQARIRESKGADRRLDGDIAKAFGLPHGYREWIEYRIYYNTNEQGARVTSSLDACVALLTAALPGAAWCKSMMAKFCVEHGHRAFICDPLATDCHTFLNAIVSAEISKLETTEQVE